MDAGWRSWVGTVAAAVAAAVLWFVAPRAFRSVDAAWSYLGWGLGLALALVAGSGYRSRRDPALLFLTAGGTAFALEWIAYSVSVARTLSGVPDWFAANARYGLLLGPLALAACLAAIVPWRDRRGRPPLRPGSVALGVGGPIAVVWVALAVTVSIPAEGQIRAITAVTAVVALVAAARAVARGGWVGWPAGGALALVLSSAAAWLLVSPSTTGDTLQGAASWFTFLPAVALFLALAGILAAQRADTSRMRRATDRATAVMEGRAEIASVVSHDVRGPAATIRSVAGSLRTSYERLEDAQRLEFVGMIEQESQRLVRVADQMSLGLKTDADTVAYTIVTRDVEGPVLQGLHDADTGEREVRVDVDPSVRAPIDGRWIAEAVRQGVENALKFSPAATPIDLRLRRDGADVEIEIEDRGPGIPPELREQVFDKFCRWRPVGYEEAPGSGLGLFIVRTIARAHGGDATVRSGPDDAGTILRIHVPAEGST